MSTLGTAPHQRLELSSFNAQTAKANGKRKLLATM
jgi:hypothetical protein